MDAVSAAKLGRQQLQRQCAPEHEAAAACAQRQHAAARAAGAHLTTSDCAAERASFERCSANATVGPSGRYLVAVGLQQSHRDNRPTFGRAQLSCRGACRCSCIESGAAFKPNCTFDGLRCAACVPAAVVLVPLAAALLPDLMPRSCAPQPLACDGHGVRAPPRGRRAACPRGLEGAARAVRRAVRHPRGEQRRPRRGALPRHRARAHLRPQRLAHRVGERVPLAPHGAHELPSDTAIA